jgi:hypothetical protein
MTMKDRATIFITEPQDSNLDYEIADEALEAVALIGGGCPTLMYNSYCFTCESEARSITLANQAPRRRQLITEPEWEANVRGV